MERRKEKQRCMNCLFQILQEIQDNSIRIYTGEIDEDDDSPEVKELRV